MTGINIFLWFTRNWICTLCEVENMKQAVNRQYKRSFQLEHSICSSTNRIGISVKPKRRRVRFFYWYKDIFSKKNNRSNANVLFHFFDLQTWEILTHITNGFLSNKTVINKNVHLTWSMLWHQKHKGRLINGIYRIWTWCELVIGKNRCQGLTCLFAMVVNQIFAWIIDFTEWKRIKIGIVGNMQTYWFWKWSSVEL